MGGNALRGAGRNGGFTGKIIEGERHIVALVRLVEHQGRYYYKVNEKKRTVSWGISIC